MITGHEAFGYLGHTVDLSFGIRATGGIEDFNVFVYQLKHVAIAGHHEYIRALGSSLAGSMVVRAGTKCSPSGSAS